jgi:hypothetical protein
MTVLASEDRGDLLRWIFSGALVLFAHGGLAAAMVQWSEPIEDAESASAIVIELAPLPVASMQVPNDIAPGPEQVEAEVFPDQPVEKVEEKIEEKIEQAPNPEIALLLPQEVKPEPPKPMETQPAPATTAPQVPSVVEAALPLGLLVELLDGPAQGQDAPGREISRGRPSLFGVWSVVVPGASQACVGGL